MNAHTKKTSLALAKMHRNLNQQKQVQAFDMLIRGMESDVVLFAHMVKSLGGSCPIIHDNSEPKKHTDGRRESRQAMRPVRIEVGGEQKYWFDNHSTLHRMTPELTNASV